MQHKKIRWWAKICKMLITKLITKITKSHDKKIQHNVSHTLPSLTRAHCLCCTHTNLLTCGGTMSMAAPKGRPGLRWPEAGPRGTCWVMATVANTQHIPRGPASGQPKPGPPSGRPYSKAHISTDWYACSTGSEHYLMMEGQVTFSKYSISHMKK